MAKGEPMRRLAFLILIVGLVGGCARFESVRFHNLPKFGDGKTIVILPADPANKGGIEFNSYAKIVAGYLEKNGYVVLPPSNPNADLSAFFGYSAGEGKVVRGSMPIIGQTGGGTTYQSGTVVYSGGGHGTISGTSYVAPTYGVVGSIPTSRVIYNLSIRLDILDAKKSTKDNPVKVFEGTVNSLGASSLIAGMMPKMVEVLFTNFPGESGKVESLMRSRN